MQDDCNVKQSNKLTVPCLCVFAALYWFNYELLKTQLCEQSRVTQANFSISFTAGAISGTVSCNRISQFFFHVFF